MSPKSRHYVKYTGDCSLFRNRLHMHTENALKRVSGQSGKRLRSCEPAMLHGWCTFLYGGYGELLIWNYQTHLSFQSFSFFMWKIDLMVRYCRVVLRLTPKVCKGLCEL